MKNQNHPSIIAIRTWNSRSIVFISAVDVLKTTQATDIPIKISKENSDILAVYIRDFFWWIH